MEYRVWNPFRSKLAASVLAGVDNIHVRPGAKVCAPAAASRSGIMFTASNRLMLPTDPPQSQCALTRACASDGRQTDSADNARINPQQVCCVQPPPREVPATACRCCTWVPPRAPACRTCRTSWAPRAPSSPSNSPTAAVSRAGLCLSVGALLTATGDVPAVLHCASLLPTWRRLTRRCILVGPAGRDLVNMAKKRPNIVPIIEDARHPQKYRMLVPMVDVIFADVAQPDQVPPPLNWLARTLCVAAVGAAVHRSGGALSFDAVVWCACRLVSWA